jgi:ABC-type branched-subunit amino acid transport system substrate-binding protein
MYHIAVITKQKVKAFARRIRLESAAVVFGLVLGISSGAAGAQDIVLAHVGPFTGPAASDAKDLNLGMRAHLQQLNARGGIAGRRVVLASFDDRYDGAEFAVQFNAAQGRGAVALLSPLGIASLRALIDGGLLQNADIVVLNAIPGATPFRAATNERLLHVRASDRQQIEKILRHARTLGITRMQVIVQDAAVGDPDVRAAQASVPEAAELAISIRPVVPARDAMKAAAVQVAASDAQAVLVLGSPPYMAQTIDELRKAGVTKPIFALSYLLPKLAVKVIGPEASRGIAVAQTFPNPMGHALPLLGEFQAAMRAIDPDLRLYSSFHLEGYIVARVAAEGLRRIGGPITPAALLAALRRGGPVDVGGFRVDFSRGNAGSNFVDLGMVTPAGRLIY